MARRLTVLHSAVTEGTLKIVKYLVEQGADVKGKTTKGDTEQHLAVDKEDLGMVKYLVEQGADVNSRKTSGWTVLQAAVDVDAQLLKVKSAFMLLALTS